MLELVTGPECPKCGCCQGETLRTSVESVYERRPGSTSMVLVGEVTRLNRRCEHCGARFQAEAELTNGQHPGATVVPFPQLRCPHCGSTDNKITTSPKRRADSGTKWRHHKCNQCQRNFTSQEKSH